MSSESRGRALATIGRHLRTLSGTTTPGNAAATVVAGAGGTVIINGTILLVTTASVVVVTRLLGPSGYGAYAYALSWSLLLASPALLGMPPLLVRLVAQYETGKRWGLLKGVILRFNEVSLAASCVTAGLGGVVGWLINDNPEVLRPFLVGLVLVPLIAFASLRAAAMQGLGHVVLGRIPEPLHLLAFIPAVVVFDLALGSRFDATWAVVANVATAALVLPLGVILLSRVLPAEAKSAAAEYDHRAWMRSAVPLVLMSVIAPLTAEIGIIALGAIKGAGPVGLFSIANRGASFVGFLFTAATYPLLPVLARLHATRDRAGLQRLLTRAARGLTLASLPFAGGLVVFTHPILGLFGAGFTHAATPLRLLVAGYFVNVVGGFSGVALLMTGHEKAVAKCTAAAAVLFIGSGAALVPRYGALGLSIATVVQLVASNVLLSVALWRHERLVAPAVPASVVTAS